MAEVVSKIKLILPHFVGAMEDDEVAHRIQTDGASLEFAEKCVTLIPLAFGRLILHSLGAETTDTYCLVDKKGKTKCGLLLMDEPIYKASLQIGQEDTNSGKWDVNLHQLIAFRSAEIHACNQLLLDNPKAEVSNVRFLEPCLILSEYTLPHEPTPWWRFW